MKTNDIFNGPRFWTYFKYDLTQMWRNHMKAAIGIGLSGLFFYLVVVTLHLLAGEGWSGPGLGGRYAILLGAVTALELYQTRTYGYLTDRRKGGAWLMLPASACEKWLSMLLMTLLVIPVLFFAVFFGVDSILALLDPSVGHSLAGSILGGMKDIAQELTQVNETYQTTWALESLLPLSIVGFCFNYLFFLLCGVCFRKHKILYAFLIIFLLSLLLSALSPFLALNMDPEFEDFAQAEQYIRGVLNTTGIVAGMGAVLLAGGIYVRIKTLKH